MDILVCNEWWFAEITEEKVELLLESIEKSNEIDVKRATEALERAKARRKIWMIT